MESIIFRYAARNNLVLYKSNSHRLDIYHYNNNTIPADAVVHHYAEPSHIGSFEYWKRAHEWYKTVVPNGTFITSLREPISHYVSSYFYFEDPDRRASGQTLETFVEKGHNHDILVRDFAIHNRRDLDYFMQVGRRMSDRDGCAIVLTLMTTNQ